MSYSAVFGGGTINPSERTYLSLVTAVDVTLQWPLNTVATNNVAADIVDVDATAPGLNVNLSDARQISNGFTSLFVNVGSNSFTVRDALGASIVSPVPGTAWFIYLTDNSTEDGTWAIFQLGATMAVADAAALAGAGIKAISTTLNQRIAPTLTGVTPVNWADANRARFTIWTGGVGVVNLPVVATVGSDWFSIVRNEGSGILTITPAAGTIDNAATLIMNPGDSAIVVTDGANWYTIGLGGTSLIGFDYVQIDVSGSGNFVLAGVQLNRISYQFIGALTGNRKIVVPNTIQQYWADNSTTGAFSFEIATAAQVTPIQILQNNRSILYCDGTNVIDAETGTFTPPVGVGQGGTGATTAIGAMANLGVGRLVDTAANSGLAGGGNLGADLALLLDADNLVVELTVDLAADVMAFYDDSASAMRKTPLSNIAAITVEEEGAPLATLANTLNFVGGAVTAAGVGATKTITIPIDTPVGNTNSVLRSDGSGWVAFAPLSITTGPNRVSVDGATLRVFSNLQLQTNGIGNPNDYAIWSGFSNILSLSPFGIVTDLVFGLFDSVEFNSSLKLFEFAAPTDADEAQFGQIWVRNDNPPIMVYTNDVGTDFPFCEEGTFTLDWSVGMSDSNVNNYRYIRIGNFVHFWQIGSNLGNSNANTCGTSTAIPVALRPASAKYGSGPVIDNASAIVLAQLRLNTSGTIDAFAPDIAGSDPPDWGNDWTTSGVKGPAAGITFSYSITDA